MEPEPALCDPSIRDADLSFDIKSVLSVLQVSIKEYFHADSSVPGSFKWTANINNVKKHYLSFVCTVEDKQSSNQATVRTRNAAVGIRVSEERKKGKTKGPACL